MLCPGEGHTAQAWGVNAQLADETHLSVGSCRIVRAVVVRINRTNAAAAQLAELLTVQWLTPVQDRLFTGPESTAANFWIDWRWPLIRPTAMASLRFEKAR